MKAWLAATFAIFMVMHQGESLMAQAIADRAPVAAHLRGWRAVRRSCNLHACCNIRHGEFSRKIRLS